VIYIVIRHRERCRLRGHVLKVAMQHVVVAGGTSPTLGRSIVTACLSAGHKVTILSRTPENPSTAASSAHGAPIKHVAYDDVESIKPTISDANVLISVLKIIDDDLNLTTHLNLLRAALASETTTRFVPSDWSMYSLASSQVDLLAHKSTLLHICRHLASTANRPDFEIAQFKNGAFLNYFAQRAPSVHSKPHLLAGLDDDLMLEYIDISTGTLPIPFNECREPAKVSMTHLDDVGKYVAAAVALPGGAWPEAGVFNVAGNTFTYEEVRDVLEKECGVRIDHAVVTPEDCDRRKAEADVNLAERFDSGVFKAGMVAQMQKVICRGVRGGSWEENVLGRMCPEVKPVDLREYLIEVWGEK
jgi:hypothetical protein